MEVMLNEIENLSYQDFKDKLIEDFVCATLSREASLIARKEVLTGKAKFGIVGDGKELPQIAMAKVFKKGDFRSGYYRDQTFMMASGLLTVDQLFAQLYADTDIEREPHSGGRQMSSHFSTHTLDEHGAWNNLTEMKNSSPDVSCTSGQMPRLLGLAYASKMYRHVEELENRTQFSNQGNEIAFGTIGDASTSEGNFWETINAACAMQVPMIISIWDDGYGISVPSHIHHSKSNLSDILRGFQRTENENGCEIFEVYAWDYPGLIDAYQKAEYLARYEHIPIVVHVKECTQPQGHSTSGSQERYKSPERLEWEKEWDCNKKFKEWLLEFTVYDDGKEIPLLSKEELDELEKNAKKEAKTLQKKAWKNYQDSIAVYHKETYPIIDKIIQQSPQHSFIQKELNTIKLNPVFSKKALHHLIRKVLWITRGENYPVRKELIEYYTQLLQNEEQNYSSHLYSDTEWSALTIKETPIEYENDAQEVDGSVVLNKNFETLFERHPELLTFGEDVGKIGDVNQGMRNMQEKFGDFRVSDTSIRESTIMGQGIGLALRGLRPIAEIQYLDYILYGISTLSDDLATVRYRTVGKQKAPMIVRTRGHRLEGIWHAGSPMGALVNLLKGMMILVPRDMTRAAGFYNTMVQSDDPCLIVESLNGYRLKEKMPKNLGDFTIPVGKVDITKEGSDITVVTYGSTWKIVRDAAQELTALGIDIEVIDIQSLIPFDLDHDIVKSIQKTNKLVVIDEDVPGGASAYMLQQILEEQEAYKYLDAPPKTITAKEHRPAFASDGDYFSKPSIEDVVEGIYDIMREYKPQDFPELY